MVVQDSGSDLNAYALVEGQAGCCSPAMVSELITLGKAGDSRAATLHEGLAAVIQRYNVNDFAASVKVFAVKPIPT